MKTSLIALMTLLALPAMAADKYTASIDACRHAVAGQLGAESQVDVDRIRSKPRHIEYRLQVSTPATESRDAICKATEQGEVLALEIEGQTMPIAQVTSQ